jgi:hypothetical protein
MHIQLTFAFRFSYRQGSEVAAEHCRLILGSLQVEFMSEAERRLTLSELKFKAGV